ncbi:ribonuclease H-like domain-containing protein [Tanacetum coccineum]
MTHPSPKIIVNSARPMKNVFNKAHSTVRRPINNKITTKNSNFSQKVNTARPKAVLNVVKGNQVNDVKASACWVWKPKQKGNPQQDLQEKGLIDSGCSRHMTRNMPYLTNFEEIDREYVAFSGNPKEGKITGRAERKNRTLIEAARTMLADSKLPTTFWVEAVNTACYVQNRVLVTKPHNKTLYKLFLGRKPALGFMRPFGCPVTILNTLDHLGKFDGKVDEGFFVRYSMNSKVFRVFNSRTRIVEENLHVQFSENTPNIAGSGPNWLFDIDALTKSMNCKPVVAKSQSNGNAGTKTCDDAGKASMETVPSKDFILLPLWTTDPPFSQSSKSSPYAGFKPSGDDAKKVTEELEKKGGDASKEDERDHQEQEDNVNSTNNINTVSSWSTAQKIRWTQ